MFASLIKQPRLVRRLLLGLFDCIAIQIAVWAAFALRFNDWLPDILYQIWPLFPLATLVFLLTFLTMGIYRSVVRYAGVEILYSIVEAVSLGLLIVIAAWVFSEGARIPRSSWFNLWLVLVTLIGGGRLALKEYLQGTFSNSFKGKRVIIYGAGSAGIQLATALQHSSEYHPVAFVDDARDLRGSKILGLKVYDPTHLPQIIKRQQIHTVLLAVPSTSRSRRREILEALTLMPIHVMAMPGLAELASGLKRVDDLREVDIEDILGRDPVQPDPELLGACIKGKSVMITGAGGSIGSELCRQIIHLGPTRLVLVERSEYCLYTIERELNKLLATMEPRPQLVPMLGCVSNPNRLMVIMEAFGIQTVYHTAAYKHVPIVEHNPLEGIRNNIFGTLHAAEAALQAGVETFVLISTDKAVRPTNVMGATKRFAELILQGLSRQSVRTRFCMVRFGNVLASSGSVVPLFREQIDQGGPVTVTHPEVIRYFMTVSEAAQLVIQAGAMAEGGDVFLLNMGQPVRIVDLAQRIIRLSGYNVRDEHNPNGDIEIEYTGLRPGEKLYEELLISGSELPTRHSMIMRAQENVLHWDRIREQLDALEQAVVKMDSLAAKRILRETVTEYQADNLTFDLIWREQLKLQSQEDLEKTSNF